MEDVTTSRCPVCGNTAQITEEDSMTCPVCGAPYAFVKYFADEDDAHSWQDKVEKYKGDMVEKICKKHFARSILSIGDRAAAVVTPRNQFLFCSDNADEDMLTDVSQISFGGRHCLLLFQDGHVEARTTSRNVDQGQCRVEGWHEIIYVEAGANCSYGVRKDGSVLVSGIPPVPSEDIIKQRNIKFITEGDSFVVCQTESGQLKMIIPAGANQGLKNMQRAVENCRGAVSVEAAKGCVAVLDGNKEVHCYCTENNDIRLGAGTWTGIIMVAVESHYVVGLTSKGKIRLAGRESVMDAGRKDAVGWENNVALACTPNGIGAVALDGTLHLAGNIIDIETLKQSYKPYAQRIAAAIIQQ